MKITLRRSSIILPLLWAVLLLGCRKDKKGELPPTGPRETTKIKYAKGFTIETSALGITVIKIASPWPNAKTAFTYALIPKDKMAAVTLNRDEYDAIIGVPIDRLVVTSTTHIPALDVLDVMDRLVGFPETKYISSKKARKQIDKGHIKDLGNNEAINAEMTIALNPEVVVGFGVNNENKAYNTLQRSKIPVVYNGDWTEETPLGKAEWIKFFAPFFQMEAKGDSIFKTIEKSYNTTKKLVESVKSEPSVITGGLYKDVWYVAGGKSWMAQFLKDARADYLWKNTKETGGVPLSFESVFEQGKNADFWLNPSLLTSYHELEKANYHYAQFDAFKNRAIYSNAATKGSTGGLLYYELAPQRPDLVLKDLIHIFHPEILPNHRPFFFKPLD